MNQNWTVREEELLARAELTDKEVAEILNRTVESVKKKRQRIRKMKIRGRKTEEQKKLKEDLGL
jgi:DNA-binding CsgD family transcriptional regulator